MTCDLSIQLRSLLDHTLFIPGLLGLQPYTVSVIQIIEQGIRPGVYTSRSVVETPITVGDGYNPSVHQVSAQDIFLSNNLLTDRDFCLGPLVKPYSGNCGMGGTNPALLNAEPVDGYATQLYFRLIGPGLPETGGFFKRIWSVEDSVATLQIYLRATQEQPDLEEL